MDPLCAASVLSVTDNAVTDNAVSDNAVPATVAPLVILYPLLYPIKKDGVTLCLIVNSGPMTVEEKSLFNCNLRLGYNIVKKYGKQYAYVDIFQYLLYYVKWYIRNKMSNADSYFTKTAFEKFLIESLT